MLNGNLPGVLFPTFIENSGKEGGVSLSRSPKYARLESSASTDLRISTLGEFNPGGVVPSGALPGCAVVGLLLPELSAPPAAACRLKLLAMATASLSSSLGSGFLVNLNILRAGTCGIYGREGMRASLVLLLTGHHGQYFKLLKLLKFV